MLVAQMAVIFVLRRPLEWPAIIFVFLPVVEAMTIDSLRCSTSGMALGLRGLAVVWRYGHLPAHCTEPRNCELRTRG